MKIKITYSILKLFWLDRLSPKYKCIFTAGFLQNQIGLSLINKSHRTEQIKWKKNRESMKEKCMPRSRRNRSWDIERWFTILSLLHFHLHFPPPPSPISLAGSDRWFCGSPAFCSIRRCLPSRRTDATHFKDKRNRKKPGERVTNHGVWKRAVRRSNVGSNRETQRHWWNILDFD